MIRTGRATDAVRARLARRIERVWYSPVPPPLPLAALERLYRRATRKRFGRPSGRPPCPVIVVGNLVVGGSGKTPVVAALVRALAREGFRVAVVSRGYGSRAGAGPIRVRSDHTASEVGDEALELVQATGIDVWVGSRRDRALAATRAAGADVVVSDDGLQHAALPRSFEVCVVDEKRGFGNRHLLPAGPLRQPVSRLAQVDLILIKRSATGESACGLPDGLRFELRPGELEPADPAVDVPAPVPGRSVDAVAGIGDPAAFFATLTRLGYSVRPHPLVDHQPIDPRWLDRLPGPVVMTAKDRARLDAPLRDDAFVLPVRAGLPDEAVQRIVEHVREFRA